MSKLEEAAREVLRIVVEGAGGLREGQQLPARVEYASGLQRIVPLLTEALEGESRENRLDRAVRLVLAIEEAPESNPETVKLTPKSREQLEAALLP